MNSTFEEADSFSSTPANASTVIRRSRNSTRDTEVLGAPVISKRAQEAMSKPFVMILELRKLTESYESYDDAAEEYWQLLEENSEAANRIFRKHMHFNQTIENVVKSVDGRIWDVCTLQQSPLPSTCPKELKRWQERVPNLVIKPGFIPSLVSDDPGRSVDTSRASEGSDRPPPIKALAADLLSKSLGVAKTPDVNLNVQTATVTYTALTDQLGVQQPQGNLSVVPLTQGNPAVATPPQGNIPVVPEPGRLNAQATGSALADNQPVPTDQQQGPP